MTRRLNTARQAIVRLTSDAYICPSCVRSQITLRASQQRTYSSSFKQSQITPSFHPSRTKASRTHHRSYSSLASSTAINAPSNIPAKYQELHESLVKLQDDAAAFVDLSRVQLALRSLEKDQPVIRVGFLTLGDGGAVVARKLAKLLLSDALSDEQPWEQSLRTAGIDGRSILLRYGEVDDLAPSNAAVKTLFIPSTYLQKHNLEILITPFRTGFQNTEDIEDALLVPSMTIPAASGRVGFVRNPVHKALLIGDGIGGAIQLGKLELPKDRLSVMAMLNSSTSLEDVSTVDVYLAETALRSFREDQAAGGAFGTNWLASRIEDISSWLTSTPHIETIARYTASTLNTVDHAIDKAVADDAERLQSLTVPDRRRSDMQQAINDWSAQAHNDLRNNLITALDSRAWKRTSWFRLLWRIDDVSYSTIDILNQYWLNETEQRLAHLSGRIQESGLATEDRLRANGNFNRLISRQVRHNISKLTNNDGGMTVAELKQVPTLLSRVQEQSGINPLFNPPWPQTINLARQSMLHQDVPAMHRKAQGLVLSTLSTIGGTTALGVWLWIATSGVALYEAGAIAALGLVWSLRRLQRLWGKERDDFATLVQEDGRRVLVEIEDHLRQLVRDGGRVKSQASDVESIGRAKLALEKCQTALQDLERC